MSVCFIYTGPSTPQNTGLMCLQSYSADQKGFKVCATGVILQQDKSIAVMKKLKLIGYPYKVHRKTAFIKVRIIMLCVSGHSQPLKMTK